MQRGPAVALALVEDEAGRVVVVGLLLLLAAGEAEEAAARAI